MNTVNIERGRDVRAAILAIARASQAKKTLFPTVERTAAALGICVEQARRHIDKLVQDGVIVTKRVGRRRRVEGIQP